jgi:signal transduction histidine kinase/ActR/RegA family two-component response regulator
VKLRGHFALLVAATLVPVFALTAAVVILADRAHRATVEQSLQDLSRALAATVERELGASLAALQTMATSPSLDRAEYAEFYAEARRAREVNPPWLTVYLVKASGEQILTLLRPLGTPLPRGDMDYIQAVIATGRPYVSDLAFGPISQRHIITINVPVIREGQLRYVIGASVTTDTLAALLADQVKGTPSLAAIRDRKGVLVARSHEHTRYIGREPSADLRRAFVSGEQRVFHVTSFEGQPVHVALSRVRLADFNVAVAAPPPATARTTVLLLAVGGGAIVVLAFTTAAVLARRVTSPMQRLAHLASRLPEEPEGTTPVSSITEIAEVHRALTRAAVALREQASERERRVAAEAAREQADAANHAKDEFLAMLGHELRNPLGAIVSAVNVLSRVQGEQAQRAAAREIIERQLAHLRRMVDDLLDAERVTTGKVRLTRRPVDFAAIVTRTVNDLQATGAAAERRLITDVAPVWINGDETRLTQVVMNLIGNALKYTLPGGTIHVDVAAAGSDAVLRVSDTGTGIARHRLNEVFELFVQDDHTLDRSRGGLGIGLTLVRRLVEMHGGTVVADSDGPGLGATFSVRLPLTSERPQPTRTRVRPATVPRRHILIVEDNEDAREMLRTALAMEGLDVAVASDAGSALNETARCWPEAAVIDIGLPGTDGYALARSLRSLPAGKGLVLVALTGYGRAEDLQRALDAGFDEHLVKPVTPADLHATIERIIAERGR